MTLAIEKMDLNLDVDHYRFLNFDLMEMPRAQLAEHYLNHGRLEGRPAFDVLFDQSYCMCSYETYLREYPMAKSESLLTMARERVEGFSKHKVAIVDHDPARSGGASRFVDALAMEVVDALVLVPGRYEGCVNYGRLEYGRDPSDEGLLLECLRLLEPSAIILNSANRAILWASPFLKRLTSSVCFHSHEYPRDYMLYVHDRTVPDFVVSERIADEYAILEHGKKRPRVQPPVIPEPRIQTILADVTTRPPAPWNGQGDRLSRTRPVLGMLGSLCLRKNPKLFAKASDTFREWDFLWVGGSEEEARVAFGEQSRVYHVPYLPNPWPYFREFVDVFVLTSVLDPCPYAVLEMFVLGIPVVTFEGSTSTWHPDAQWHALLSGEVQETGLKEAPLGALRGSEESLAYVRASFSRLNEEYKAQFARPA